MPFSVNSNSRLKKYSTFVQTVNKNKKHFTAKENKQEIKAIELKRRIENPTLRRCCKCLSDKLVKNCPVKVRDARIAEYTCGTDT